MIRSKFIRALVLGMCLTVFSSTAAFADTDANQATMVQEQQAGSVKDTEVERGNGVDSVDVVQPSDGKGTAAEPDQVLPVKSDSPDASVSSIAPDAPQISDEMLKKQSEIDQYLFEQHKEEIAGMGFSVTHTAPTDEYVEIGITPFNEENAEYLYKAFGRDMVKVVEGMQATTMEIQTLGGETAELYSANVVSAQADDSSAAKSTASSAIMLSIAAAVAVLLVGTLIYTRRQKMAGR